ncbi:MAG: HAMP domain-containing sensor histidine kinase, partial [Gemmatimonadaceae bacterium]
ADRISEMINACHELTAVMVHVMIDRARVFKSSELLDEKLVSIGRMAAGLAHELNNPASAVARSAKTLVNEIDRLDGINKQVGQLNLSDTQYFSIATLRDERNAKPVTLTPIEVADREDAMTDWLDEKGVGGVEVEQLAASAFGPSDLEALSVAVGVNKIGPVLSHIASEQSVRRLAREINTAASRIHALVDAVKGFTYMDQQTTLQPIAIGRGLSDTIIVLGSKARGKATDVQLEVAPDLPTVNGYGGELNQVWSNLIDNAIDAAPKGKVRVTASVEIGMVVVRVTDNGKGIPDAILARIFDPFFTTKPVGEGTGLGLDISRRIVQRHHGALDVTTGEHGTEFRVTLPVSAIG